MRLQRITTILALTLAPLCVRADKVEIAIDGQSRSYVIERPTMVGPRPTVIMLHGINGTAEKIAQRTGLDQAGPRQGFVVVFPQSRGNAWNRFLPGNETARAREYFRDVGGPPNDVGFLKRLVSDLTQRGLSDRARIYLAGLSNGGFLALSLLCTAADSFAAIGLLVTAMPEDTGPDCHPSTAVPVLMLAGTADQVVPYAGGVVTQSTITVWSFERLTAFVRQINGCDGSPGRSVVPNIPQRVEIEYSGPCRSGPMVVYRIVGGTHISAPDALHTGQLLLDFFRDKVRGVPNPDRLSAQPVGG
jgi:polyhydroxybutyrate depolymerase